MSGTYHTKTNTWSKLPDMPEGVNHAAGVMRFGKFYVIGGRGGGNYPSDGFETVQVLNLRTKQWKSTHTVDKSVLAPFPVPRAGAGMAVNVGGKLYVIGGETLGLDAYSSEDGVYSRVDVYIPRLNKWRVGPPLLTARHGIYPAYCSGSRSIHVIGGSTEKGYGGSSIHEVLEV